MRSITRQSTRLANCTRSRQHSLPRRRETPHKRSFNTTARRHNESRPHNGTPDSRTSVNETREHIRRSEHPNAAQQEQPVEQDEAEAKPVTSEGRRSGNRKTLRQRRMNDVPKPPPIPAWFLKHNVKLYRDNPGLDYKNESGEIIRVVDTETGHTLFTFEDDPRTKKGAEDKKRRVERQRQMGKVSMANATSDRGKSSLRASIFDEQQFMDMWQGLKIDHDLLLPEELNKLRSLLKQTTQKSSKSTPDSDKTLPVGELDTSSDPSRSVVRTNSLRWCFLEAESSVRAAFSLANAGQNASSFARDRVDISLQCPDVNSHDKMDEFVEDIARVTKSDIIRLDANDIAELTENYVGQGHDEPGTFSSLGYDVFDGYAATGVQGGSGHAAQIEKDRDEMDEDEEEDEDEHDDVPAGSFGPFGSMGDLRKMLQDGRNQLGGVLRNARVIGVGIGVPPGLADLSRSSSPFRSVQAQDDASTESPRDEARLAALLENLLDAPENKQTSSPEVEAAERPSQRSEPAWLSEDVEGKSYQPMLRYWRSNLYYWVHENARIIGWLVERIIRNTMSRGPAVSLEWTSLEVQESEKDAAETLLPQTIIHIRDLRDICNNSRLGNMVVQRLVKVVRKRRRTGQRIVIVGTTCQDAPGPFRLAGDPADDFPFRALSVPPFFNLTADEEADLEYGSYPVLHAQRLSFSQGYDRILQINLRHIQAMLRRLRADDNMDLLSYQVRGQLAMPGMSVLAEKVLTLDQVQRIALFAVGLAQLHAWSERVNPIHLSLARAIIARADHAEAGWVNYKDRIQAKKVDVGSDKEVSNARSKDGGPARMEHLKKICNQHETRLLSGTVDPQNIKIGFADVHAPIESIEALKTLTTLSLLRPEAFKYGVLANDRLPGLLLYGPPGTGKTLLAKAVAKESKATVLEVSGAQIYEKYVGEGEKMVRAVFSLAKKLSPCVVFIDEADAIFGSRSNAGNRNTHREIINQFLREWDGMDDHSVFMMVATNRPFDLDDAVLRRLPRRLLIDLPSPKDREAILNIHLKDEVLDPSVSLHKLAEQTPLYSGSDLKNLAVAAALACVREENALAESQKDDKDFKLPDKRTLTSKHFEKASAEISASISEDMSSLHAIKKFDEQYGDRKGRRKKTSYGFGASGDVVDESAARVRVMAEERSPAPPPT